MQRKFLFFGTRRGVAAAPSTALTGLANYWKMDETSDGSGAVQRNDTISTMHLTDTNTCPSVAGIIGNGAQFVIANSERLGGAHGGLGNFDFTIAGWYYADASVGNQSILGSSNGKLWLRLQADNKIVLRLNDGTDHECGPAAAPSLAAWHYFVAWYDATLDKQFLQIDNGTAAEVANTGGVSAGAFTLQFASHAGALFFFGGRIDEVGYWTRVLTADERTELYNSGVGKTHPF
jgi:hypothetical protein